MTRTGALLGRLAAPHAWARAASVLLASAGVALAAAAAGMAAAPRVGAILAAWATIAVTVGAVPWWWRRVRDGVQPVTLARAAERAIGARQGSVVALLGQPAVSVSADLLAAADRRAEQTVAGATALLRAWLRRGTKRRVAAGVVVVVLGAALLLASSPTRSEASAFWHPVRTWVAARAPVRVAVDRGRVRRGDSVRVTVRAPTIGGRVTLATRGPGEAWRVERVTLDSAGTGRRTIGPLRADLFVRAASGDRESTTLHVVVETPPFLADLALTARYPAYLARPDEPLVGGLDTVSLPAGTAIVARGSASARLASVEWRHESASRAAASLRVSGNRFEGRLVPAVGGVWRLVATPQGGGMLEGGAPELRVLLVQDSAPVVRLPVPGRDTTLPLSLRQPLVIDARDDHGLARLDVVSRRVSRTGLRGDPVRMAVDADGERVLLQTELDLRDRSLLPGDTVRLRVDAWDRAPTPHVGRSDEIVLRLPSMEELRAASRDAARAVGVAADSVLQAQSALADRTRDLAQERARAGQTGGTGTSARAEADRAEPRSGAMPFEASERAEEVAREQAEVSRRIAELAEAVEDIARTARAAGVGDSAFAARLAEVRAMLQRALTPELADRLKALSDALARLDPGATREALQRLAEAQARLRAELERSAELFRRAAAEGALASLAADAEALRDRQRDWNRVQAPRADTSAARTQLELAGQLDSLARGIAQATRDLRAAPAASSDVDPLATPRSTAGRARGAMKQAADGAAGGDARRAGAAGEEAAEALAQLPDALRRQRDSLVSAWREETLLALGRALGETAALAGRQEEIVGALARGETGSEQRGQLGVVEQGTKAVERQIRAAASRHALVPQALERALGFAQQQLREARQQLEQSVPNISLATTQAQQGLAALNVIVYELLRAQANVAGAGSGSGLAEALEQLTRLAGQQRGLNAETAGLAGMPAPGGAAVLEQLRSLAARQRALAEDLERLQAGGASGAAGPLAEEARQLARALAEGQLDLRTVERQEQLYRRLLDAGRTLQGNDPDERKERVARAAQGDSVHRPGPLVPGATGRQGWLRYPSWEELRGLTAAERRMVLEYFRRLNAPE